VNNHAGALDVFQELDSETVAEVCAFDQPRQVGDGERPLVRLSRGTQIAENAL
jgi:hypothetical protein